ncbi:MAG: nickel pincer cofactor biosynthesis protein LarC [Solirubrobacterales bacterium]|nr:nickel pincer cofactor biosynthesis protein LarC [Solirubrobacterales bacterium]
MSAERLLYIDAIGGAAGDMLLGALLDAGARLEDVRSGLRGLGVAGLDVAVEPAERQGVAATSVRVIAPEEHIHRDWAAVRALVDRAGLPPRAHARVRSAFERLARAEGRAHHVPPDQVQFHEIGAIDALADVCGVALALEALDIDRVACSPLPAGRGLVFAAHGVLPLPAPATLELLRAVPLYGVECDAELVTPTGAALVAALAEDRFGPLPPLVLESVGYGAGARDLHDRPNVVRVLLGPAAPNGLAGYRRPAVLVECTLDDLSGELVADAAAACVAAGALDTWVTAVQMKKGRPGFVLTAVVRPEHETAVAKAMLRHTSTLGVRLLPVLRWELDRKRHTVLVDDQPVAIKVGLLDGGLVNLAPEHEDVVRAADALGRPAKIVWAQAWAAAERELNMPTV